MEDQCRELHQWSPDNTDQLVRGRGGEGRGGEGRERRRLLMSFEWCVVYCLLPMCG